MITKFLFILLQSQSEMAEIEKKANEAGNQTFTNAFIRNMLIFAVVALVVYFIKNSKNSTNSNNSK